MKTWLHTFHSLKFQVKISMNGQGPPLKRSPVGLTGGDRGTRNAERQGKKFMSKNSLKTEFEGYAEGKGS